jgi:hypothetical protein
VSSIVVSVQGGCVIARPSRVRCDSGAFLPMQAML